MGMENHMGLEISHRSETAYYSLDAIEWFRKSDVHYYVQKTTEGRLVCWTTDRLIDASEIERFRVLPIKRPRAKLKFHGVKFRYKFGDGCVDDSGVRPWVLQHPWKFGWETQQQGRYFFLGFCYLSWEWR